jgi:hypothetical protein
MLRFAVALAAAAFVGPASAGLESGPKVGSDVAPFHVIDVTGEHKGKEVCYRCQFGDKPVVAVFAREMNEKVEKACKELDKAMAENPSMRGMFVMIADCDCEKTKEKMASLAKKHELKKLPMTLFVGEKGPDTYKINAEAGVTVVTWKDGTVMKTKAYKKGDFCDQCCKSVVAEFVKKSVKTEASGG